MGSLLFCDVFYPKLTMIDPLGASVFVFDHDLKIHVGWFKETSLICRHSILF